MASYSRVHCGLYQMSLHLECTVYPGLNVIVNHNQIISQTNL